jgi:hypothetical protein
MKHQLFLMSGLLASLLGATSALGQGRGHAPALARSGEVLAVETAGLNLWRIDPVNLGSRSISAAGLRGSVLSFDRAGNVLVIGDGIQHIDFETREVVSLRSDGFGEDVVSADVSPEGDLYIATQKKILRVDPSTGDDTVLVDDVGCLDPAKGECRVDLVASGVIHDGVGGLYLTMRNSRLETGCGFGYIVHLSLETLEATVLKRVRRLSEVGEMVFDVDGDLLVSSAWQESGSSCRYGGLSRELFRFDPAAGVLRGTGHHFVNAHMSLGEGRILYGSSGSVSGLDLEDGRTWSLVSGDTWGDLLVVPGPPPPPSCRDGIDNDEDGPADFPADFGCSHPDDISEAALCDDGWDNDGDGLIDYPEDPGCADSSERSQEAPQCSDGIDNEADGFEDYPDDPECLSASDNEEHWNPRGITRRN